MAENTQAIPEFPFLISPPGSEEAKDIGYINVPKIFEDPPPELDEVHHHDDQTGFLEFPHESNFWVSKRHIELKGDAFDLVLPLLPKMLRYAIPWIVCEYGLYCVTQNKLTDLKQFTGRTIKRRASDYEFVGQALFEKRWRKARTPIPYLRTIIKRIKKGSEQIETDGLFGADPPILSIDEPIITGDPLVAAKNGKDFTWGNILDSKKEDIGEFELVDCLIKSCKLINLSDKATQLVVTHIRNVTDKADAARYLNYSVKEYDTARREISRKREALKKQIHTSHPDIFKYKTPSD